MHCKCMSFVNDPLVVRIILLFFSYNEKCCLNAFLAENIQNIRCISRRSVIKCKIYLLAVKLYYRLLSFILCFGGIICIFIIPCISTILIGIVRIHNILCTASLDNIQLSSTVTRFITLKEIILTL